MDHDPKCICDSEAVAVGFANCDACDDVVVTYDDLIEDEFQAMCQSEIDANKE